MQLHHSFTVPSSVQQTWDTFMDLELVGGCFPGATVTEVNDDGFAGTVKVKLGPIALVYGGTGSFIEKDDATHLAVIKASGKDKRGNGTAGATVRIQLTDDGGSTKVDVATDLAVTGKPAQFGRGVMQDVSDKLLGQFVRCIEDKLGAVPGVPADAPAAVAAEPAAATAEIGGEDVGSAPSTEPAVPPEAPAVTTAAVDSSTGPTTGDSKSAPRTSTGTAAKEDDALNGLSLIPIVLKSLWQRLLVAVRLRKPEA